MESSANPNPLDGLSPREKAILVEFMDRGLKIEYPVLDTSKNIPQHKFVSSPKQFVLGIAGNRAGKSDASAYRAANFSMWGKPALPYYGPNLVPIPNSGWIVSLDYPSSREIMVPKFFRFVPSHRILDWKPTDGIAKIWHPGGKTGKVEFRSDESGWQKFQGADKHWIAFDEEGHEEVYKESRMRIAANAKLHIWFTLTPLLGMTWVYTNWYKAYEEGKLDESVEIITPWTIYDNKANLDPKEIQRLERELNEYEKLVRLYGKFLPMGGQPVFDVVKLFALKDKCVDGQKWEWNPMVDDSSKRFRKSDAGNLELWTLPKPYSSYLISADVSEGTNQGDWTVADVSDISTGEQCAQWRGKIDTFRFAELLADLGDWYNEAAIMVETYPGPGGAVNDRLKSFYTNICETPKFDKLPDSTRFSDRIGWRTTAPAKQRMIQAIKQAVEEEWIIRSKQTITELITFVKTGPSSFGAQFGCNDDCVISYGIMAYMVASGSISSFNTTFMPSDLKGALV